MPNALNKALMRRIRDILVESLPDLTITDGWYVGPKGGELFNAIEAAAPAHGPSAEELREWLGASPLSMVVADQLFRRLPHDSLGKAEPSPPLLERLAISAEDLADELVGTLDRLPFTYTFAFPVPRWIGDAVLDDDHSHEIGPGVDLVQWRPDWPHPDLVDHRPFGPGPGTAGDFFLLVTEDGYQPLHETGHPFRKAEQKVRGLVGVGRSVGAWSIDAQSLASMFGPVHHWAFYWKAGEQDVEYVQLARSLGEGIANLKPTNDLGKDTHGALISNAFDRTGRLMRHPEAGRILRASRWMFESETAEHPALCFVQAMVAAEVLLGDKALPDMSLGSLLANRAAYLLGESHDDRELVLKLIPSLYDLRSRIVHRGHDALSQEEEQALTDLRWICYRIIRAEGNVLLG